MKCWNFANVSAAGQMQADRGSPSRSKFVYAAGLESRGPAEPVEVRWFVARRRSSSLQRKRKVNSTQDRTEQIMGQQKIPNPGFAASRFPFGIGDWPFLLLLLSAVWLSPGAVA